MHLGVARAVFCCVVAESPCSARPRAACTTGAFVSAAGGLLGKLGAAVSAAGRPRVRLVAFGAALLTRGWLEWFGATRLAPGRMVGVGAARLAGWPVGTGVVRLRG